MLGRLGKGAGASGAKNVVSGEGGGAESIEPDGVMYTITYDPE